MNKNPVVIIPWQMPYLENLKKFVTEEALEKGCRSLIIMPNTQPWRYLAALYMNDKKASLLPKLISFPEMVDIWFAAGRDFLPHEANLFDQVWLLRQAVLNISDNDPQLASRFAKMEMSLFLPWGLRLSQLLEKIHINGSSPRDMTFKKEEVGHFPSLLLGALGRIDAEFRTLLEKKGWITRGLKYLEAMRRCAQVPASLLPGKNQTVTLAAFSGLWGAENALLESLWLQGANVCLHADPGIIGGDGHWACRIIREQVKKWKARMVLYQEQTVAAKPAYSFFTGYDGHSQLEELAAQLSEDCDKDGKTAIVLCDKEMLVPVMHHVSGMEINAAMGYPINRSAFYELINLVFRIQENHQQDNLYYWKDIIAIVNNPFLDEIAEKKTNLKKLLKKIDDRIRSGGMYIDPMTCLPTDGGGENREALDFLREYFKFVILEPGKVENMRDLAAVLREICVFLLACIDNFSNHFPLDAEVISRFVRKIIPSLNSNEMAAEALPLSTLKALLDELGSSERIAFKSDPLKGVQIVGLSGATALNFKRILVLDATDDLLPGRPPQDPLLPDSFSTMLNIPDGRWFEAIAAYDLFRLCAGAKEVEFLWYEGLSQSGLIDSKKIRSRFVERLIWEVEQDRKKILKVDEEPLKAGRAEIAINARAKTELENNDDIQNKMALFLNGPISASALNDYLACPLSFAFKRLMNLSEREVVREGRDHLSVGNCLHEVLHESFLKLNGKEIPQDFEARIMELFNRKLEDEFINKLPIDSWLFFKINGAKKLRQYISTLVDPEFKSKTKYLEEKVKCEFIDRAGNKYILKGKVDRVDEREGKLYLLDYKTGEIHKNKRYFWDNEIFFNDLENIISHWDNDKADSYLLKLKNDLVNIQLPFYLLLLASNGHNNLADACFVDLGDECREKSMFNYKADDSREVTPDTIHRIGIVVEFILTHMRKTEKFKSLDDKCPDYCAYKMCKVMAREIDAQGRAGEAGN